MILIKILIIIYDLAEWYWKLSIIEENGGEGGQSISECVKAT